MSWEVVALFSGILAVAAAWAAWSLRDLSGPRSWYPKVEKRVKKVLSGVIELPGR